MSALVSSGSDSPDRAAERLRLQRRTDTSRLAQTQTTCDRHLSVGGWRKWHWPPSRGAAFWRVTRVSVERAGVSGRVSGRVSECPPAEPCLYSPCACVVRMSTYTVRLGHLQGSGEGPAVDVAAAVRVLAAKRFGSGRQRGVGVNRGERASEWLCECGERVTDAHPDSPRHLAHIGVSELSDYLPERVGD